MPRPPKVDPLVSRIDALLDAGVTLTAIAAAAGVQQPHLSRWLAARRVAPPKRIPIGERLEGILPRMEAGVVPIRARNSTGRA